MVIFHSYVSLPEGIISILEIHEVLVCPSSNADGATSQHSNGNNWAVEKCNQDMAWKSMHARTYYNYVCCICVHTDIYIYITYIHNHIYIHISYTWVRKRTCVTSKCTPEIEHTTLKKKLCSKDHVLSETGWKWLCFGWSPNFIQFLPVLSTTQIPSFVDEIPTERGLKMAGIDRTSQGFFPGFSISTVDLRFPPALKPPTPLGSSWGMTMAIDM